MIFKTRYILLALITCFLASCETDLDINADWEEITIVYGILNPNDSIQYIKINKAFLGEGNPFEYAKVSDSLYHKDSLDVTLIVTENGNEVENYSLIIDNSIIKSSTGTFAGPNQILYRTPPNTVINSDYTYKIEVKKKNSNEVIASAETDIVKDYQIYQPTSDTLTLINFVSFKKYRIYNINWESAENGRLYELIIRFNYLEVNSTDSTEKYLDWEIFDNKKSNYLSGGQSMFFDLDGERFYKYVNDQLSAPGTSTHRVALGLDFMFSVAGEDLSNYIEVNQSQTGLVQLQVKPEYTNIDQDGKGIFSSKLFTLIKGKKLSSASTDTLSCGSRTSNLRFLNSKGDFCK